MDSDLKSRDSGHRELPRRQVIITMAGVMLALFFASLDQTIVGTALPRIITDLGGFAHYTWVATAYIISSTVTLLIAGKLSDMYGRKWFLVGGIAVFIVGQPDDESTHRLQGASGCRSGGHNGYGLYHRRRPFPSGRAR